jgi:predicted dehydrogenase
VFDDIDGLMNDPEIDAIDALVPVQFNKSVIEKAIAVGKPISIEKPISSNIEDAREIVKLANSTALPVLVLENFVYHNSVTLLKAQLPKIGNTVTFMYQSTGPYAVSKYHATTWRQKPEHVGGYLSDGGVHHIAVLTEVLGEVESVSGRTTQLREVSGDVDTLNSLFHMKSGSFGTFIYGSYFGNTEKIVKFTIFGTKGSIVYEFKAGSNATILVRQGDSSESAIASETFTVEPDQINGVTNEFANFAEAIKAKDKNLLKVKPETAFHHFAVIAAAVESAEKGGALTFVSTV